MRFRDLCVLAVAVACVATATLAQADYVSTVLADSPFLYFRLNETAVNNGDAVANVGTTGVGGTYVVNANGDFGDPASVAGLSPGKQFNHYVAATDGGTINVPAQGAAYGALNAFTYEFLLNPANYTGAKTLYSSVHWPDPNATQLNMSGGGIGVYVYPMPAAPTVDISAAAPIGQWSHVAVTTSIAGATAHEDVYVNGSLVGGFDVGSTGVVGNFDALAHMGHSTTTWMSLFDGGLDEFAIYDSALSGGTILNHAVAGGFAIPEPGTLALLACGLIGLLAYAWRKRK